MSSDTTKASDGFTKGSNTYDEAVRHNIAGSDRLVMSLPDGHYPTVLDVGCGTGWTSAAMVRRFGVETLVGKYHMENYHEDFRESFRWATNWKVLAENFMESYHLPMCHKGTIGGASKFEEMVCPEGLEAFNYHTILKDETVPLALAHASNTTLTGDLRRTTWLFAIYPSLMITLTPGYFWYLSLTPDTPGRVKVLFGGGMSEDWLADPKAEEYLAKVKALHDKVNVEDKGCTEKVYRGLLSEMAAPGPLSPLERPNYDFARYLDARIQAGLARA